MIPDRFDALAKALPAATRRDAMRVLVGLPLAGGLASLLTPGEPASARKHGRKPEKKHRRARGKKDRNRADPDCPTCTCPPDRRLAAVDACRAKQGVAVAGSARGDGCNCAWLNSATSPNDYRCNGECLCWLTLEGSGWCGAYDPPLPGCTSSEDCAPGEVCWVIDGICTCEGSDGNCTCEGLTSSCVPVC
jgi:hypothetical protein